MTNREALQDEIGIVFPDRVLDRQLSKQRLNPFDEVDDNNPDNVKAIDLALVGLIRYLMTMDESIRELDYQLTRRSMDDLIKLASSTLNKWGEPDTFGVAAQITDISDLH